MTSYDEDEGRISGATWRFEDGDHTLLKDSGFKFMLMELLDSMIHHRASEKSTDTLNGVIHLEKSSPFIQWLTADEAEKKLSRLIRVERKRSDDKLAIISGLGQRQKQLRPHQAAPSPTATPA